VIAAAGLDGIQPIDFSGVGAVLPRVLGGVGDDRLVVLYDRDCGICTATARALLRWDHDGQLGFVPLQEAAASDRPQIVAAARDFALNGSLHVVDESTGQVAAGGDAVLRILGQLPAGRVARLLGSIPPFAWVVSLGYALVARNRHRIGRWLRLEGPACEVPR